MVTLSLLVNLFVLLPVCAGILGNRAWVNEAYGPRSPARGILLSVYVAILLASTGLLIDPVPGAVGTLLGLQVAYKLTTPFTVGTLRNPVVISNLAIAAIHAATLATL